MKVIHARSASLITFTSIQLGRPKRRSIIISKPLLGDLLKSVSIFLCRLCDCPNLNKASYENRKLVPGSRFLLYIK